MTTNDLLRAFEAVSARIDENRYLLVSLDQQNGDGDLGISMSSGFHAAVRFLRGPQETDWGRRLNACGDAFNEAAPSSLGTILTFFLKGMARDLKGVCTCDLSRLARAMRTGLDNVTARAGSKPGEKTILDSLDPGVTALEENARQGVRAAFEAAARAARDGSERTREMTAVWGRAAYYGERSVGVLDGGSVVGALIFEALRDLTAD